MLLAMTTWFSATAVLPQLRTAWTLTTVQSSFLTIAVQVGFVVGALVSAFVNLADIIAARTLMLVGALGAAAVNLLLVAAHSAGPAIGLRFLTGAFLAGVYPPGLKAMSAWFRAGRGTALGIMVGALTLGAAAPQFLNGIGGADWHSVIVATSVLTVLGGLTARYLAADGPFPFPKAIFDPRQAASVMRNRAVRLAALGYFGHQWELYAMWAWIFAFSRAAFTVNGEADPARDAAFAAFAIIGSGAAGCWAGGILGDRWGRTRLTRLAMALSGTCCVLIGPAARLGVAPMIAVASVLGFLGGGRLGSVLQHRDRDERAALRGHRGHLAAGRGLHADRRDHLADTRRAAGRWMDLGIYCPCPRAAARRRGHDEAVACPRGQVHRRRARLTERRDACPQISPARLGPAAGCPARTWR